jgi:hypothetical protein
VTRAFENEKQTQLMKYEFHPFTKHQPLMAGHEIDALGQNIKEVGQLVPIVTFEGQIIDGRNRYLACQKMGIEPRVREFNRANAKNYAENVNLIRKHWTTKERAHYAALISLASPEGHHGSTTSNDVVTEAKAAEIMNVSVPSVQRAKAKIRGKTKPPKPEPPADGELVDKAGIKIPPVGIPYWNRIPEAKEVLSKLRAAKKAIKELLPDDPMWSEVNLNGMLGDLGSAINRFSSAIPEYVCPYCKGKKSDACNGCKGKAVISEFLWKFVPEELRKMHEIKRTFSGRISS